MTRPEVERPSEVILRALGACGMGDYSLGAGDYYPEDPDDPFADGYLCDCSGFAAFAYRYRRKQPGYADGWGWVNTDSMICDALTRQEWWRVTRVPQPGDLVVYGARYKRRLLTKKMYRSRIGHVGVLVDVPTDKPWNWKNIKAAHCSAGNERRFGHAIAVTDIRAWDQPKTPNPGEWTYFLRYKGFEAT